MRAFYISEPNASEICEIPVPSPGPGEVLLETRLVGLCGSDLNTFRGLNPMVSYPRIPGHEIAAVIAASGPGVPAQFHAGRAVTVSPYTSCGQCSSCRRKRPNACQFNQTLGVQRDGAMANFFVAPWEKLYIADGLSLPELSLVEPLGVGFHAVTRAGVEPSDFVAVIGCGTVGLGAIAAAAARGAVTIAVDIDDHKLDTARQAGAAHSVHSGRSPLAESLKELTGGLGPDVVIEAVGTPATFRAAVEVVAFTGRVVYIGYAKEPVSYETKLFVQKELDIRGSRNSLDEFPAVIEMLRGGRFPVAATISRTVNLGSAGQALTDWSNSPQSFTKILVQVG